MKNDFLRFKRTYIEISNICNLNCSFCSPVKKPRRSMTIKEFEYIANQIRPFGRFVYFHIKGEPLLHKDVSTFFDIAHQNDLFVNITTNGTLIKDKKDMLLSKPALRQVNISLHSILQLPIELRTEYLESIIDFSKKADEKGIFVVFRLWLLDEDKNLSKDFDFVLSRLEDSYPLCHDVYEKLKVKNSITLTKNVFLGLESEFEWPSLESNYYCEDGFCYGMRTQIGILADGTVVPCCLDSNGVINLGNIYEQSFKSIVNSDRAKSIYNSFTSRKAFEELCRHCSYKKRFDIIKKQR